MQAVDIEEKETVSPTGLSEKFSATNDDNNTRENDASNKTEPLNQQGGVGAATVSNDEIGGYVLDSGDRLRVIVFGEEDLSGTFEIDGTGRIYMPLIGGVQIGNKTISGAQKEIATKLHPGYLKNPKISIEVTNYRDFYILGEVKSPGNLPYRNGLTVINAVALAGGYTGRASKENITVVRTKDPDQKEVRIGLEDVVLPGDILRVKQRLF